MISKGQTVPNKKVHNGLVWDCRSAPESRHMEGWATQSLKRDSTPSACQRPPHPCSQNTPLRHLAGPQSLAQALGVGTGTRATHWELASVARHTLLVCLAGFPARPAGPVCGPATLRSAVNGVSWWAAAVLSGSASATATRENV